MIFFSLGILLVNIMFKNKYLVSDKDTETPTPIVFNVLIFSIISLVVTLKIATGNYYHVTIGGVTKVSNWSNLLAVLSWISYCGLYLQMIRYFKTRSSIDGLVVLTMMLIPIILFLPSGNRESAIEHLPIAFIIYLTFESNIKLKILMSSFGIALIGFLLVFMYAYRDSGLSASDSVIDQYSQVAGAEIVSENQTPVTGLIQRLSEYVALGRVIDHVPSRTQFSGLEGMDTWWQIFLPGVLRPDSNKLNFNEPAEFSRDIGIAPGWWSSAPLMLKGDLFRRFGWLGLALGMFCVGFLMRILDYSFISKTTTFRIIIYTLMAKTIWRLYANSLLGFATGFTRDLLVAIFLAYALTYLSNIKLYKKNFLVN